MPLLRSRNELTYMAKHTIKDRLIAGLKAMGYTQVENERSGMTSFHLGESDVKMFVGTSGALRRGRNKTSSHSLQDTEIYRLVLAKGDAVLNPLRMYTDY